MTKDEFQIYWSNYLLIEKRFLETRDFVAIDVSNFKCYSSVYQNLILSIGSEIDNILKLCSGLVGRNDKTMGQYCSFISSDALFSQMINQKIYLFEQELKDILPINDLTSTDSPLCWTIYNKIKHERHANCSIVSIGAEKYYKYANLEYCIKLLAFLYICEMYAYRFITNDCKPIQPLSRLFYLDDNGWKKDNFIFGLTAEVNGDTLNLTTIEKPY